MRIIRMRVIVSAATVVMQAWRGQVLLSWHAGKAVSDEMRTTKVRDRVPPSARTALSGTQLLATDLRPPSRASFDTLHGWKSEPMSAKLHGDSKSAPDHQPSNWIHAKGQPAVETNAVLRLQSRLKVLLRQIFRRAVVQA